MVVDTAKKKRVKYVILKTKPENRKNRKTGRGLGRVGSVEVTQGHRGYISLC